jgi:hypothetical protein
VALFVEGTAMRGGGNGVGTTGSTQGADDGSLAGAEALAFAAVAAVLVAATRAGGRFVVAVARTSLLPAGAAAHATSNIVPPTELAAKGNHPPNFTIRSRAA